MYTYIHIGIHIYIYINMYVYVKVLQEAPPRPSKGSSRKHGLALYEEAPLFSYRLEVFPPHFHASHWRLGKGSQGNPIRPRDY